MEWTVDALRQSPRKQSLRPVLDAAMRLEAEGRETGRK